MSNVGTAGPLGTSKSFAHMTNVAAIVAMLPNMNTAILFKNVATVADLTQAKTGMNVRHSKVMQDINKRNTPLNNGAQSKHYAAEHLRYEQ